MNFQTNVIANYAGRFFTIASTYAFTPFHVSALGVESYGLLSFHAILFSLSTIADAGLSSTLSRESARTSDKARLLSLVTTFERLLIVTSGLAASLIVLIAPVLISSWLQDANAIPPTTAATTLRLLACTIPFNILLSLYISGLTGTQNQVAANTLTTLYTVIRTGLVIPLINWCPHLYAFAAWQLISAIVFFMVARTILLQRIGFSAVQLGAFNASVAASSAKFAFSMLLVSIIANLNTQIDKLVVSKLFAISDLAYYTLASTLAQLPYAVSSPLIIAYFPRFNLLACKGNEKSLVKLYSQCTGLMTLLSSLGTFCLFFFSKEILTFWLNIDRIPAEIIATMKLLTIGSFLLSLATAPFYFGLAHGHNKTSLLTGLLTLLAGPPIMVYLACNFGIEGASASWIFSNSLSFITLYWFVNRRFYHGGLSRLFWSKTFLPSLAGFVTMYLARAAAEFAPGNVALSLGLVISSGAITLAFWLFAEHHRSKRSQNVTCN
jgi:O-antigen/teichoic acid export membrane protein